MLFYYSYYSIYLFIFVVFIGCLTKFDPLCPLFLFDVFVVGYVFLSFLFFFQFGLNSFYYINLIVYYIFDRVYSWLILLTLLALIPMFSIYPPPIALFLNILVPLIDDPLVYEIFVVDFVGPKCVLFLSFNNIYTALPILSYFLAFYNFLINCWFCFIWF